MKELSQINLQHLSPALLRVIVRQNNFLAGEIDLNNRTFYSVPRSAKNLFYLFGEPGLGLNSDLLHLDSFDTIKIKYNSKILITTRLKWLAEGINSPYCNEAVDKQIILHLSKINLDHADKYEPAQNQQQELFEELT